MELLIEWGQYTRVGRVQEVKLYNRGDVIAFKPDGWAWTAIEKTNPTWRIFRANLTEAECEALVAAELDIDGTKNLTRKRARKLKTDGLTLPQQLTDYLADDTRAEAMFVVPDNWVTHVRAMEYIKPDADSGLE